jgi:hypothetical protein
LEKSNNFVIWATAPSGGPNRTANSMRFRPYKAIVFAIFLRKEFLDALHTTDPGGEPPACRNWRRELRTPIAEPHNVHCAGLMCCQLVTFQVLLTQKLLVLHGAFAAWKAITHQFTENRVTNAIFLASCIRCLCNVGSDQRIL